MRPNSIMANAIAEAITSLLKTAIAAVDQNSCMKLLGAEWALKIMLNEMLGKPNLVYDWYSCIAVQACKPALTHATPKPSLFGQLPNCKHPPPGEPSLA